MSGQLLVREAEEGGGEGGEERWSGKRDGMDGKKDKVRRIDD